MGFAPVFDIKATIHDFLGVGTTVAEGTGRLQQDQTMATGGV